MILFLLFTSLSLPLLFNRLINKQDIEGALEDVDLIQELDIETLVNKHECPTKIVCEIAFSF